MAFDYKAHFGESPTQDLMTDRDERSLAAHSAAGRAVSITTSRSTSAATPSAPRTWCRR